MSSGMCACRDNGMGAPHFRGRVAFDTGARFPSSVKNSLSLSDTDPARPQLMHTLRMMFTDDDVDYI